MCQLVISSSNPALQINALWALKNGAVPCALLPARGNISDHSGTRAALYQSTAEFKRGVLTSLTWDHLATCALVHSSQSSLPRADARSSPGSPFRLIASPDVSIAELALSILRNITAVTNNEAITGLGAHEIGEERLLGLLQDRIAVGVAAGGRAGTESLVEHVSRGLRFLPQPSRCSALSEVH